ncbi:MAG: serine hydrolase, partial [Flavobacteriaceae bacterium]
IKELLTQKPPNKTGFYEYRNVDYALFRFILPRLTGYNELAIASMGDSIYGQKFRDIVQELVFKPIGIKNTHVKMPNVYKKTEMLCYSSWNTKTKGEGSKDQHKSVGSTGWFITCRDLAKFYNRLWHTEKLLPKWLRDKMFDEVLGYDHTKKSGGVGYATKGGQSKSGRAYFSRFIGFKNGVSMVVYTNNNARPGMERAESIITDEFQKWYKTKEKRFTLKGAKSKKKVKHPNS